MSTSAFTVPTRTRPLLTVLLLAGVLTACGGNSVATTADDAAADDAPLRVAVLTRDSPTTAGSTPGHTGPSPDSKTRG